MDEKNDTMFRTAVIVILLVIALLLIFFFARTGLFGEEIREALSDIFREF